MIQDLPELLALNVETVSPWPPGEEMDPYHCNIRFSFLSEASSTAVRDFFHPIRTQVQIVECPPFLLIFPDLSPPKDRKGAKIADHLRQLLDKGEFAVLKQEVGNCPLIGSSSGLTQGPDGASHQSLEDIALMRALPNMTVLVPADGVETRAMTLAAAHEIDGPVYLRLGRYPVPDLMPADVGAGTFWTEGTSLVNGDTDVERPVALWDRPAVARDRVALRIGDAEDQVVIRDEIDVFIRLVVANGFRLVWRGIRNRNLFALRLWNLLEFLLWRLFEFDLSEPLSEVNVQAVGRIAQSARQESVSS